MDQIFNIEIRSFTITGIFIIVTALTWIIYDFWVHFVKRDPKNYPTLSKWIREFAFYSPIFPFIIGAIIGHFFL